MGIVKEHALILPEICRGRARTVARQDLQRNLDPALTRRGYEMVVSRGDETELETGIS